MNTNRFATLAAALGGLLMSYSVARADVTNPIIPADVPDIAMIRVGSTYYMSATTNHMAPGLPILKSEDLVNWRIVNYAYDTLDDTNELNLIDGKNAYGGGSWASSLRVHNGTYYATTFSGTTGKTYVYTTKDIERGPWTKASFKPMLHDHTLVFDDGKPYMIYGGGELRLVELTDDLSGLKPGGVNQVIIQNASVVAGVRVGLPAEGSQLLKHDGKYYLFNITWPRDDMRTQIVHRADKLTGPWEGRVFLRDRGVAQGSIIDTPDGKWFAYLFQDSASVGRWPWLVPMRWEDGWPVVDARVPDTLDLPASTVGVNGLVTSDEFDRKPGDRPLPLAWQWNHNPVNDHWSITDRPGFLRLTTPRVDADFVQARNSLTQRTFGPTSAATTMIDVSQMKDGDLAGIGVLQARYGLVGVKQTGNTRSIVMISAERGAPAELASVPMEGTTVHLKIACDFRSRTDKAYAAYSLDGHTWTPIGQPLQMAYTLPHFIGYRFALFNFATRQAGGSVDFDFYRVGEASDLVPR